MSITDELREYAWQHMTNNDEIRAIADRIDAEHEREVTEATLATTERGWVRLPVDADGEPLHIGDKVDSDYYEDGTVTGIQFYETANGGIRTRIAVRPDGWDVATWYAPDGYRHHHAPTVEDVLREMCLEIDRRCERGSIDYDRLFAEYAARLRLREDA